MEHALVGLFHRIAGVVLLIGASAAIRLAAVEVEELNLIGDFLFFAMISHVVL